MQIGSRVGLGQQRAAVKVGVRVGVRVRAAVRAGIELKSEAQQGYNRVTAIMR